jgi:hypothetical protein
VANRAEVHRTLAELADGPALLARLVNRTPDAALDHRDPERGGWSAREILAHLADLEFNLHYGARVARILAEDRPELCAAEPDWRALEHRHGSQDPRVALGAYTLARKHMVGVLQGLPAEAWDRVGIGADGVPRTLLELAQGFIRHERRHAARIRELYAQVGFAP